MAIRGLIKNFLYEIITFLVTVLILAQFTSSDFSRRIITSFTYFRPEYTFTLFVIFVLVTVILVVWLFVQTRKKVLKSTKNLSAFAKTIVLSHKARRDSVTQTVYFPETAASVDFVSEKVTMPEDIDGTNPNVIEIFFNYEVKRNI